MNPLTPLYPLIHPTRLLINAVLLASLWGVHTVQAQARFNYSANGSEVTDSKTSLTWRRCSEGQRWNAGTCSGTAALYNNDQARELAQSQAGWRLPSVKELASLIDPGRKSPSIDLTAFPATPSNMFWTSSPTAHNWFWASASSQRDVPGAWGVNFYTGKLHDEVQYHQLLHVRLVR